MNHFHRLLFTMADPQWSAVRRLGPEEGARIEGRRGWGGVWRDGGGQEKESTYAQAAITAITG